MYTSKKDAWFETYLEQKGYSAEKEIEVEIIDGIWDNHKSQLSETNPELEAILSYSSDHKAWEENGKVKLCVFFRYILGEPKKSSQSFGEFILRMLQTWVGSYNESDANNSQYLEELQMEEMIYVEIDKKDIDKLSNEQVETFKYESSAQVLQKTVASWYKTLRTLAIVALLTILLYVGIRIVLSSTAKDKAKYKQMIMDWLVAVILVFVLHYVMAFILYVNEQLTQIFQKSNIENVIIQIPSDTEILDNNYSSEYNENMTNDDDNDDPENYGTYVKLSDKLDSQDEVEKSEDGYKWSTNYMGMIRYMSGLPNKEHVYKSFGYTIMYIVLVIYTCVFTFMYLKRVLWMAFLTMIAPLVAITYPIDKVNDGQAQGFKLWLREYIFNALLQPIHYLIYTIIMGSVMNLVKEYPVYAIVALGFMIPAEKFIRKMFGFEKAQNVSKFGGAAGAAFLMGGIKRMQGIFKSKDDEDDEKKEKSKPNSTNISDNKNPYGFLSNGLNPMQTDKTEAKENGIVKNAIKKPKISKISPKISKPTIKPTSKRKIRKPSTKTSGAKKTAKTTTNGAKKKTGKTYKYRTQKGKTNIRTKFRNKARLTKDNLNRKYGPKAKKLKNGAKTMKGYLGRRLYKRSKNWHPIRAMRRGVAFTAGAALGGAISGAAAIVNPEKAETYLTAGIFGGGQFAVAASNKIAGGMHLKGGARAFKAGAKGEKYEDIETKERLQDFKMDNKNRMHFIQKFGADGDKDLNKKGGLVDRCFKDDITEDLGEITKIASTKNKLLEKDKNITKDMSEDERNKLAEDKALTAHKIGKTFGDISNDTEKSENFDKICKARGFSDDQIKDFKETFKLYQES